MSSVDVGHAAGVSQATVSYVFSGRKGATVPEATRELVLRVANELGYRPNSLAQSLRTGQTNTIALCLSRLYQPISGSVIHYISAACERDGYEVILSGHIKAGVLTRWPVDGILIFDGLEALDALLKMERIRGAPIVSMGPYYASNIDYVGVDLGAGARDALACLLASGRQRIAYFTSVPHYSIGSPRYDAYIDAMTDAGRTLEIIKATTERRVEAREEIKAYIRDHGCPDALFCLNDDMAIGAYRGLRDLGLAVPEEVALVGCDGIDETNYHDPTISTISQPVEEMSNLGWQFLKHRLANPDLPQQHIVLPARFEMRGSSPLLR